MDQRIAKSVDSDGAGPQAPETVATFYDGAHAWADFDAAGNVLARYLFGDGVDEVIARFRPGEGTAWYLSDHLGTVRDILDTSGAIINTINYDSFGGILNQTNSAVGDRFTFTGREWDPELSLYYYRARYYDPTTGRFISQDPFGFTAGDMNLYRYVGNRVLGATDPSGQTAILEWAIGVTIDTALNVGCAYAELWATKKLDDPWEIAQHVSFALAASTAGAVLGSGLATRLTLKAFTLKTAAIALGGTAAGSLFLYAMIDAYQHGATSGDWRLFHIRAACTVANFLVIPIAAGTAGGLRSLRGALKGLGPDIIAGFALTARQFARRLNVITGVESIEALLRNITNARRVNQLIRAAQTIMREEFQAVSTANPGLSRQALGQLVGRNTQQRLLELVERIGLKATSETRIDLPEGFVSFADEGLASFRRADILLPNQNLILELTIESLDDFTRVSLHKQGQLADFFMSGFKALFINPE